MKSQKEETPHTCPICKEGEPMQCTGPWDCQDTKFLDQFYNRTEKEETPEKPDFEAMAIEYATDRLWGASWPSEKAYLDERSVVVEDYKAGAERIWNDYYLPTKEALEISERDLTEVIKERDEYAFGKTVVASKEVEADKLAIDFADYMDTQRWRYDHQEQRAHTIEEHLAYFKQCESTRVEKGK